MATAGLKIVLPGTFSDATLPVLYNDSVMAPGTLCLIDLAHSANPLAAGVPLDSSSIPNIAWQQAATVIGSGTQASLAATFSRAGAFALGAGTPKGVFERSGKGGLHCAVARATAIASGDGARIILPAAVVAYAVANPTHSYFASLWSNNTRINDLTSVYSAKMSLGISANTVNGIYVVSDQGALTTVLAGSRNLQAGAANASGVLQTNLGTSASFGTPGSTGTDQDAAVWGAPASSYNNAVIANRNQHWLSWIFYRMYLEDLTVSGRSYAVADAADLAAYTRDVLTTGGRYNSDTFTPAATLIA